MFIIVSINNIIIIIIITSIITVIIIIIIIIIIIRPTRAKAGGGAAQLRCRANRSATETATVAVGVVFVDHSIACFPQLFTLVSYETTTRCARHATRRGGRAGTPRATSYPCCGVRYTLRCLV